MRISDWSSDVCSSDLLKQAGEEASAPTGGHQGHGSHANHEFMRGMATSEQLAELAAANGTAFDRQFLTLMMEHHKGAITMVEELQRKPGTAYEPVVFQFTNDVVRSEERRVGKACVSRCISRWSAYH